MHTTHPRHVVAVGRYALSDATVAHAAHMHVLMAGISIRIFWTGGAVPAADELGALARHHGLVDASARWPLPVLHHML